MAIQSIPPIQPTECGVVPDKARAALQAILISPAFSGAGRGRQFLKYVVEEALAGRSDRIKAYTIATQVFGRDESFDAQNDPIVRVEAGRVRRALDQYYLTTGASDRIRIRIDKGGYAPIFERSAEAQSGEGQESLSDRDGGRRPDHAGTARTVPRVEVKPVESICASEWGRSVAGALTGELVSRLAAFRTFVVQEQDDDRRESSSSMSAPGARYQLKASVVVDDETVHLNARLIDTQSGDVLWGHQYLEKAAHSLTHVIDSFAGSIASVLASANGIVAQAERAFARNACLAGHDPRSAEIAYYTYQNTFSQGDHTKARHALLHRVAVAPDDPSAWALLAMIHVDEHRFRFTALADARSSLAAALDAADRALNLDAQCLVALRAKMLALNFAGSISESLDVGRHATTNCPDDPDVEADYGRLVAYAGDWERGGVLMSHAKERQLGSDPGLEMGLAWCSYMRGDYDAAASRIKAVAKGRNPIFHLTSIAIHGRAGQLEPCGASIDWLQRNAPSFLTDAKSVVPKYFQRDQDQIRVLDGLTRAGVSVC